MRRWIVIASKLAVVVAVALTVLEVRRLGSEGVESGLELVAPAGERVPPPAAVDPDPSGRHAAIFASEIFGVVPPPPEERSSEAPDPPPLPDPPELIGLLGGRDGATRAILRPGGGAAESVAEGGEIGGFVLRSVAANTVILRRRADGAEFTLELFRFGDAANRASESEKQE